MERSFSMSTYGHHQPSKRAGYPASGTRANPGTKSIIELLKARPAIFTNMDPQGQSYSTLSGSGDQENAAAFEWVDPARPAYYRRGNAMEHLTQGDPKGNMVYSFNPHSLADKPSLDNNLLRSAQAPGYLPSDFPLLSPP